MQYAVIFQVAFRKWYSCLVCSKAQKNIISCKAAT